MSTFIEFSAPSLFVNMQAAAGCISFDRDSAGSKDDSLIKIRVKFPEDKGDSIKFAVEIGWCQTIDGTVLYPSDRDAMEKAGVPVIWTWAANKFLFPKSSFTPEQLGALEGASREQAKLPSGSLKVWAYAEGLGDFTVRSWTDAKRTKPNKEGVEKGYFVLDRIDVSNLAFAGDGTGYAVPCDGKPHAGASREAAKRMAEAARAASRQAALGGVATPPAAPQAPQQAAPQAPQVGSGPAVTRLPGV